MRRRVHIAIITAVVLAAYYSALGNGFVYDDNALVLHDPWIKGPSHIPDIFLKNSWGFVDFQSNYYRPVTYLIFMLCYGLFGLVPWGYHLVNILLHAGVSVIAYLLTARLMDEYGAASRDRFRLLPLIAGLFFAAHPVHTEAVAWVAGVTDLSFALFGLLSLYLYTLSGRTRLLNGYYAASVASFFIALFCKEPALCLLGVIFAYDYAPGTGRGSLPGSMKRLLPFLAAACVYLAFRFHAIPDIAPRNWHSGLSHYQIVINAPVLFFDYLWKLILPINLNVYHVLHPASSILEPRAALSAVAALLYLTACLVAFKKDRAVFIGMCMVLFPLLPVLYIPALGENAFAERYLYMPSAGFVIIAAALMSRAPLDRAGSIVAAVLPAVVVVGIYTVVTIDRNAVFKDDLSLWTDTVKKSPDAAVPHNNLGSVFMGLPGFEEEAIEQFRTAVRLKPEYCGALVNLGAAYKKEGRTDDSIEAFEQAVRIAPGNASYHNNLGVALKAAGRYDEAMEELGAALRLDPANEVIRKNLVDAVQKQEDGKS